MSRDDLFKVNAGIGKEIVQKAAEVAPNALIAIVTNPVNTIVPIAGEVLKKVGKEYIIQAYTIYTHNLGACIRSKKTFWSYHFGYSTVEYLRSEC